MPDVSAARKGSEQRPATGPAVEPIVLEGRLARLEPLDLRHVNELCEVGLDEELWRWTVSNVVTPAQMRDYVEAAMRLEADGRALPFAIIAKPAGRAVGSTRYGNIDLSNRRLEIGWTWIGRDWQRTSLNTEVKYLLLRHAFEQLSCIRVEFKTDALNEKSRTALERIGAREEGTLRKHMITSTGRIRGSVYFSITDDEWPAVKALIEKHLRT